MLYKLCLFLLSFNIFAKEDINNVRFSNFAGEIPKECTRLMKHLQEVKEAYENNSLGKIRRFPSSYLFSGPLGVGKTTIIREIISKSGWELIDVDLYSIFNRSIYSGNLAIQKVFSKARALNKPVIIFIDDISIIGKYKRNGLSIRKHLARSVLQAELDDLARDDIKLIKVIFAVNEGIHLDWALTGRINKRIELNLPSSADKLDIIEFYNKKYSINISKELEEYVAEITEKFTGSNIELLFSHIKGEKEFKNITVDKKLILYTVNLIKEITHK